MDNGQLGITSSPLDQKLGYAVVGDIGAQNILPNCYATLGVSCYLNILANFMKLEMWQEPCKP